MTPSNGAPPRDRHNQHQIRTTRGPLTRLRPVRARASTRAQVGPLGIVLVLAMVIIGTMTIVSIGGSALSDARQQSELDRAELAMLQFDSRTSMVALGSSNLQSIPLGPSGNGQYDIEPDAGRITIVHHNYANGVNETIYEEQLGTVVYRNDDSTVAYQAGGVWRSNANGSTMVTPPEFHYRDETLVLPVINVNGSGSASGSRHAIVTAESTTKRIYPAEDTGGDPGVGAPYDDTGAVYENPVRRGYVTVTVTSEYYQAWGRFLETQTKSSVELDHSAQTATVELSAPRFVGEFDMPTEGNAVPIRGIDTRHSLETFVIRLAPDDVDAANFNNLQWTMYANNGRQKFELHLKLTGPNDDPTTLCKEQDIAATIYYTDANGNPYQGWYSPTAFQTTCTDRDNDGLADETRLVANLSGTTPLTMTDLGSKHLQYSNTGGADRKTEVTFDEHADHVDWEPTTFTDGANDTRPIGDLTNHYFALLGPDFDLVVDDKNSNTVNEKESSGVLLYDAHGRVTFMHVTSHQVTIELE